MGKKLILSIFVAVAVVAAAWGEGVADFAFPRKVSAEALTQIDKALKSGDGNAVVDAMIRYSIAESSISRQSIDTIMPRIELLAAKEKRADIKALLYHLEARILRQYYAKYGAQSQVVDTVPVRYELWSKSQIKGKIKELVSLSLKDENALLAKPLSNYAGIIGEDKEGVYPSLYHFLALQGYLMTSDDAILTCLLANCEPSSDIHMEVIRKSLSSPVHKAVTKATSRGYVAMAYLKKYIDKESVGALLQDIDMSDEAIALCEEYVSRFPEGRYASIATNKINRARTKSVDLIACSEFSTHDSIKVRIDSKNIDTLSIALYRINDYCKYDKSHPLIMSDLTLIDKLEDVIIKNDEGMNYMYVYFPPQTYGRYVLVPSYKNDYGNIVNFDFINNTFREFVVHDLMLMGIANSEAEANEFLAVDMTSGAPVEGATVSNKVWSGVTDRNGFVANKNQNRYNEYHVTKGDDKWGNDFGMYFYSSEDETLVDGRIYTDLGIYRPGEKVDFVGVVYSVEKVRRELLADKDVKFEFRDPNNQLLDTLSFVTDSWGRVNGSFTLPKDRMNGRYWLRMIVDESDEIAYKSIEVSEYKVPTFSLLLDQPRRYYLGEDVEISGTVTSYSGMPVAGAKVHIEVESSAYHYDDEDEVAMPDTIVTTDATGRFVLIIPADIIKLDTKDMDEEDDDMCYRYEVEVTNDQGESHSDSDVVEIVLNETSKNVRAINAKRLLDGRPSVAPVAVFGSKKKAVLVHYKINDKCSDKERFSGIVMSDSLMVDWSSVPSGLYEFEVWADGDTTHTISELLLYRLNDKKCYLENEPLWLMPGGSKVTKKGKGEVLIGTSVDESHIYYIATTCTHIISRGWLHYKPGIHKFTIDMPKDAGESVTVHFYNVYNKESSTDDVRLEAVVPPSELNIRIESFRDKLVPGETEQWRFTLLDNNDKSQKGAFMLEMVDKAIFDLRDNRWTPYFRTWNSDLVDVSFQSIFTYMSGRTYGPTWHKPFLKEYSLELPDLNTYHRNWFVLSKNYQELDLALNNTKVESTDSTGIKVTGYVYSDEDFEPLIGASVVVNDNPTIGAATDFDGKFTITVSSDYSVISVKSIGYKDFEFKASELPEVIVLEVDESQVLSEVVVTDYQNVDKRLYTSDDVSRVLEGRAAGVSVTDLGIVEDEAANATFGAQIRVRGATSIYGSSKPLWVVDGVIVEDNVELDVDALSSGDVNTLIASALQGINIDDIDSFEILKDGSATSIYGARAMAGVIVVNTKSKQFARNKMLGTIKAREPGVKTALWKPMLVTGDDGRVAVEFTAPENNSTWVVQAIAYNENLLAGSYHNELITSRPLMVKPIAPRFLRHGDNVILKAQVQNDDDKEAMVDAVVEMFDIRTNAVLHSLSQQLTLAPQETKNVEVTWTVPDTLALVGMRVKAATERWGDGEQIVLPVLEAASPVIEAQPFFIDAGETQTVTVPSYPDNARITLETCENPLWYAIMALPTIYSDNDKVASCIAHSLYAQSVAQELAHSSPEIAKAIRSWQGDTTVVSMLAKNPSLKIGDLMASPFVGAAQRETLRMRQLSNLLDSTKMDDEHERLVKALGKLQQRDGGWAWFSYPGCESSLYTTLGVLELIGEQMIITEDNSDDDLNKMLERGVVYCDSVIVDRFAKGETIDYLSYAYVRSMFPNIEMSKKIKAIHDRTVREVVAKWKDRSLIDRAYIAIVLYRNDKKGEARKIAQSLREFAVTDNHGMHWDNLQEGSGAFYDKVTLTATVLEALALVDPREDEIAQIHKWMLLMKQSNDWGSSSLAAHAVYALLTTDGGNQWMTDSLGYSLREISPNENIKFDKKSHPQWGAIYSAYNAPMTDIQTFKTDDLAVTKNFMRYGKDGELEPFTSLNVGDKVQVRITIDARKDLDYITVTDERASCFEPVDKVSGYKWGESMFYYNEVKDSKTNIFITSLRKGVNTVTYDVMVTNIGTFSAGIASAQCQYSPQVTAHTAAMVIEVK